MCRSLYLTGPIVRVTPDELHVSEAWFYRKLFVSAAVRKTELYPRFGEGTGFEGITPSDRQVLG